MKKNDNILIESFTIGGILNPMIYVRGNKLNTCKLYVLVDKKKYFLSEEIELGRDFAVNHVINKNKMEKFTSFCEIPRNSKNVELYIVDDKDNSEFLTKKGTNIFLRIILKIFYEIKLFPIRIRRFFQILKKILKVLVKHHFIITPKLMKRYFKSLKNNMGTNNMDDYFYDHLNQKDYLAWLSENNAVVSYENLKYCPLISVIVPVYNVASIYLEECIESVLNQTYDNFELVLVDDCSTNKETIATLEKYKNHEKVNIIFREKNGHISESTNTGIEAANGEFISLLDNDDVLDINALYYTVLALNENKKLDMLYSDEDKIYFNGQFYFPHFKPDYSPDTLLSSNYICHFTTLRKSIVEKIGGFRSEYNGSQDYDLFLRFTEVTTNICHIPKILYHWRMIPSSTATSGDSKNYAYIAGQRALEDALKRRKIDGKVKLIGTPQMYEIEYLYKKEPKITIIIPTKDRANMLDKCLNSIYSKTKYKNFEIIVVSNNSKEKKTFNLLEKYKNEHKNFSYMTLDCQFNYSYLNNEAVKKAHGEYIVLLNNDIEIISGDWLSKMVGYAMQKHIGCVGIKLLYPTLTIQHAGVVLGGGGIAAHAFIGTGDDNFGYFGRLVSVYDYGAVTAACLMVKKSKFNEVNGLDENLKVAYNDVDFNMKLLEKGYYNVLLPFVKAIHYESVSRGNDLSKEHRERFINEITYMTDKWKEKILKDRFYNDNLSYYYPFHLDKKLEDDSNES